MTAQEAGACGEVLNKILRFVVVRKKPAPRILQRITERTRTAEGGWANNRYLMANFAVK